jgi:hypothetical protein
MNDISKIRLMPGLIGKQNFGHLRHEAWPIEPVQAEDSR